MRWIIKTVVFNAVSIYALSLVFPGVHYQNWSSLFWASAFFGFLTIFVKPVLKVLLFPLNLLTFGLLSSFLNVFFLYLVSLVVEGFTVRAFALNPFSFGGYTTPPLFFSAFWAYVVVAAGLGLLNSFLWLLIG